MIVQRDRVNQWGEINDHQARHPCCQNMWPTTLLSSIWYKLCYLLSLPVIVYFMKAPREPPWTSMSRSKYLLCMHYIWESTNLSCDEKHIGMYYPLVKSQVMQRPYYVVHIFQLWIIRKLMHFLIPAFLRDVLYQRSCQILLGHPISMTSLGPAG